MQIELDKSKNEPIVTLNESDIIYAFENEKQFKELLHTIVRECYGEYLANICFPLGG